MQSVTDIVLEQHRNKLKQGAVLVDPSDMGITPKVMFIIDHSIKEGADPRTSSRRMQFVEIDPQGKQSTPAGRLTSTWSPSPRPTWPDRGRAGAPWITRA
jgi:hypothetical protein